MTTPRPGRGGPWKALPWLLFPLSGAAGLGWQLVWTRLFTLGLGHELPALLGVVTAFLGGMAAGNWLGDRRLRPARGYAILELIAGGWGILSAWLIPAVNDWALGFIGPSSEPAKHAVVAFLGPALLLLPATVALGGTFPAMERWRASSAADGRVVGFVYGLNTLGAFAGTLGAAFVLMPALGLRGSCFVLGGINLLCAALAWLSQSPFFNFQFPISNLYPPNSAARNPAPEVAELGVSRPGLHARLFITGLLGIGFELAAVRALSQVLENTVFTFAVVLAVYLLGTAAGAAAYQCWLRQRSPHTLLAALLSATAAACAMAGGFTSLSGQVYEASRGWLGDTLPSVALAEMLVATVMLGPATVCMGATFSHLVQAARGADGGVGRACAVNLLGGALAGPMVGALLLPAAGLKWTLLGISLGYLAISPRPLARIWITLVPTLALVLALAFALPGHLRLVRLPPGAKLVAWREGRLASVAVIETPDGHRALRVNNRFQMGGTAAALAQRRQAEIPLLLHPRPERALFLGPGTGITPGAAAGHPGLSSDAVELVPEIIELMPWFEPHNRAAQRQPNVRLHCADARRFARGTTGPYDVIVADLFHPGLDGAGTLYTREHFTALRRQLAPGGLCCQWLPLHQLDEPTLQLILRTFLDVFPDAHGWLLHFNVDIPVLGLIGALDDPRWTPDWLEQRRTIDGTLREQAKAAGLGATLNLLGCHVAGPRALRELAGTGPLNTDDRPLVMFHAPRFTGRRDARPEQLLLSLLNRCRSAPSDVLSAESLAATPAFAANLTAFVEARDLYLRGLAIESEGRLLPAFDVYLEAAGRSLHFTPAYARCVSIIQAMAVADRPAARKLFERLEAAQPAQPLGRQLLGPLLDAPAEP